MFPDFDHPPDAAAPDAVEETFAFFHKMNKALFALARVSGLHFRRMSLLHMLSHFETLTQTELAERIGLDPSTLSPLIRDLERQGLISRHRDERDARHLYVRLSEEGACQIRRFREILRTFNDETFGRLTCGEQAEFYRLMRKLSGVFDERLRPMTKE